MVSPQHFPSIQRWIQKGANIHPFYVTLKQGILDDDGVVAVKKLAENSPVPRDKIFANEVQNIMVLEHENIVKLVAYCRESENRLVQSNGRHIIAEIDLFAYKEI